MSAPPTRNERREWLWWWLAHTICAALLTGLAVAGAFAPIAAAGAVLFALIAVANVARFVLENLR